MVCRYLTLTSSLHYKVPLWPSSFTVEQKPTNVSLHISIHLTLKALQTGCILNKGRHSANVHGWFIFTSKQFRPGLASLQQKFGRWKEPLAGVVVSFWLLATKKLPSETEGVVLECYQGWSWTRFWMSTGHNEEFLEGRTDNQSSVTPNSTWKLSICMRSSGNHWTWSQCFFMIEYSSKAVNQKQYVLASWVQRSAKENINLIARTKEGNQHRTNVMGL